MINTRFDIQKINVLKDILLRLNAGKTSESIREDVETYFKDASIVDVLLTEHEFINKDYGITIADLIKLSSIYPHLYSNSLNKETVFQTNYPGHPVQVLKEENTELRTALNQTTHLFESLEKNPQHLQGISALEELKEQIARIGEFHKHYNRKEKLFFPLMERYGHFDSPKLMWKGDDRIRALYKALNSQISQFPNLDFKHVQKTYNMFEREFKEMIFQEEAIILPVLQSIFRENDWLRIAKESDAFGYVMTEFGAEGTSKPKEEFFVENKAMDKRENVVPTDKNIPFGGGYLTTEEANLILNNLPLEITFVDKNSMFKYFNAITKSSDMMLVRTPISIGRNVANCHPPKSLKKVMTLIRDLKTKKRTSESMWFKKGDQYIHLTYKPLFNEQNEFLGILEYVQDIQPFFDLPSEIKRGLSSLDE